MKTKNMAVSIIVAVLVVALWWTMLLKPTRAKVAKAKSDTTAQEAKLAPLQQQLSQAQRDAAHAAEFKAQLESLQLALPNSPALAAFIRNANGVASAAGVKWQSVTHATPTPGLGGVQSISVSLQVEGTYGHLIDYLGRLAAMKRLFVVDNLQLAASSSSSSSSSTSTAGGDASAQSTGPFSGGDQLTATIAGRMFALPDASSAAAMGQTGTPTAPAASSSAPASSTATG
jgi:Tfp pilus assembly protein PilO